LDPIIADLAPATGEPVALLVNGLGATPPMELAVVARAALARLRALGLMVERAWCGNFMTAIEMPGVSLTVLSLGGGARDLLDDDAKAPAWPGDGRIGAARHVIAAPRMPAPPPAAPGPLSARLKQAAHAVA